MYQTKKEVQNIVKEIKQYQKNWLRHVQKMDANRLQNKYYNINQKDERTQDDLGRDGGTNFILRIKEQETRLTLQEHDDNDDDDDNIIRKFYSVLNIILISNIGVIRIIIHVT